MATKGFRILQLHLRQLGPRRLESATFLLYHDSHDFGRARDRHGAVAQLGERLNGIQEVRGSIPLGSTKSYSAALPLSQLFRAVIHL